MPLSFLVDIVEREQEAGFRGALVGKSFLKTNPQIVGDLQTAAFGRTFSNKK